MEGKTLEIKEMIEEAMRLTYTIRVFLSSIMMNLATKDATVIKSIRKKAEYNFLSLEELVTVLDLHPFIKAVYTKQLLVKYQDSKSNFKAVASRSLFTRYFKKNLLIYSILPNSNEASQKKFIPVKQIKKIIKTVKPSGLVKIKYIKGEMRFYTQIKAEFDLRLRIIIQAHRGYIISYSCNVDEESINNLQLLSMFESFCNAEFIAFDMNTANCIIQACNWVYSRKDIYTEKCKACESHLSFSTGVPMLPLCIHGKLYFHVQCFYDITA